MKGASQHPLYAALTGKDSPFPGDVKWNFGKFLIGRDGKPLKRFEPGVKPETPRGHEGHRGRARGQVTPRIMPVQHIALFQFKAGTSPDVVQRATR